MNDSCKEHFVKQIYIQIILVFSDFIFIYRFFLFLLGRANKSSQLYLPTVKKDRLCWIQSTKQHKLRSKHSDQCNFSAVLNLKPLNKQQAQQINLQITFHNRKHSKQLNPFVSQISDYGDNYSRHKSYAIQRKI